MRYGDIRKRVRGILHRRDGIGNVKDSNIFERELTGLICGIAHENGIDDKDVAKWLLNIEEHVLTRIDCSGSIKDVSELIDWEVRRNPLYELLEYDLMYFKPGRTQVGPGEFFLCFFDKDSTFGISSTSGYDIIVDDVTTELKKHGSNFTNPEMFNKYQSSSKVDRLLVVKPVSNAAKPVIRSKYSCIDFRESHWSSAFGHRGNSGTLHFLRD
tara:strand:+ start:196 stop:834 length:639 start_codon:yes stop_codon:yes gene_type:complete